jgi:hypothetical protein
MVYLDEYLCCTAIPSNNRIRHRYRNCLDNPLATIPSELNWVTTLTTVALNDYITAAYGGNFKFNHVTTTNGVTFETLGVSAMTPATGGWLEIPLHFRSNSAEQIQWFCHLDFNSCKLAIRRYIHLC